MGLQVNRKPHTSCGICKRRAEQLKSKGAYVFLPRLPLAFTVFGSGINLGFRAGDLGFRVQGLGFRMLATTIPSESCSLSRRGIILGWALLI